MAQSDAAKQKTDQKASEKDAKNQRSSKGRLFFVLFAGLGVLIWFAPRIIAVTSLKSSTLPLILKRYPGEIRTGDVSLGWTQPAIFQNIAFQDFDGRDIARIDRIQTQKTLWEIIKDRKHIGNIGIEGVTSLTYVDDQGLANRQFLTAIVNKGTKDHPEGEPGKKDEPPKGGTQQSLTLHISDLDLYVVNAAEEETPYLTGMQVKVTRPEKRTEPILVQGQWKQPSEEKAAPINPAEMAFTVSIVNSNKPEVSRSGALKFKTSSFDLKQLTPILEALSPGAYINGISNSELEVKWSGTKEAPRFAIKGNWEATPFLFGAPEWIGGDEIKTDSASGNIDVLAANGVIHFKEARANSQLGNLTLQGSLNWADLQNESQREKLAAFINSRMKLSGDLNLAEAARQLPETIHLKPGMQITSGMVDFQVSNYDPQKPEQSAQTTWNVGLKTSDLTGRNKGREILWRQPVSLVMQIVKEPESYQIQSLKCESDFLKLSGSGNAKNLTINLDANLDQLSTHLDQFLDLETVALKGKMDGQVSFQTVDQGWETLSYLNFENLQLAFPNRRGWREPSLKLTVEGAGETDPEQIHVERFIVTLIADKDAFQAKLEQPTTVKRKQEASAEQKLLPFKVQLKGKLASWADRLQPLSNEDQQLGGEIQFASSVSISNQMIVHENTSIDLTNMRIETPTLWFHEPRAEIKTAGSWDQRQKKLQAPTFSYRGNAMAING